MSDKRWYDVEGGEQKKTVYASSRNDAVKVAWKRNPPKNLGILVRTRSHWGIDRKWAYLDSRVAMRLAGHKVQR
jgi:hypothetical protein